MPQAMNSLFLIQIVISENSIIALGARHMHIQGESSRKVVWSTRQNMRAIRHAL